MKKIVTVFMIIALALSVCACGESTYDSTGENSSNEMSESYAKTLATQALYDEVQKWLPGGGSAKYTIASVTKDYMGRYEVDGTVSYYDAYGNYKERHNYSVKVGNRGETTVKIGY